jgi:hypothetical protein
MPVAKGLPERPKKGLSLIDYILALEKYVDDLENFIDARCFQDGDDEDTEKEQENSVLIKKETKDVIMDLLGVLAILDEATLKEFIAKKYPDGVGLFE